MNKEQRKVLAQIEKELEGMVEKLEAIRDAEQSKLDNLPENLQLSTKADEYEEIISNLEELLENLEQSRDSAEQFN